MRKNPWLVLAALVFVFGSLFTFVIGSSVISLFGGEKMRITSSQTILKLKLEGVIMDGRKFLKHLTKYREDKSIKAIVIEVNSPGGVVGPSQELNYEIKRTREEFKKPVVVVSTGLNASGAFYASVAADKIIVMPGTLIGSIGVIMEFMNLEKLYDWAKVSRYSITTGKYKDSGAEYRPMRDDERQLFQDMADEVLSQFKTAVAEGRNIDINKVSEIADGRVVTGKKAIELGLADQIGSREDALKVAAEMAGLTDYDVFEPQFDKPNWWMYFRGDEDEETVMTPLSETASRLLKLELAGKPLFLMPGVF